MKTKNDIADDFETYKEVLLDLGIKEDMIDKRISDLRNEVEIGQDETSEVDLLNSPAWR